MSLLVWMPFNKDDKNYGLSDFSQKSGIIKLCDDGKIGKCADLTNCCSLFFPELTDKKVFSISFWIYCKDGFTTNWNKALVIYDKKADGKAGSGIRFESESEGICTISNNFEYATISGAIRTTNVRDTWHHICVTCDGSVFTAYLNGEKIRYIGANGGSLSGRIAIGRIDPNAIYTGFMNDLRIYDEIISPKMIKFLSQGLICHIPMGNVDGMIGGRNFIKNSAKLGEFYPNGISGVKTIVNDSEALSGYHIEYKCTESKDGLGVHLGSIFPKESCKIGKTYTWSLEMKYSKTKEGNVGHECGGTKTVSVTTSWQKFSRTWVFTDYNYQAFILYFHMNVGEILYLRDLKIEEGTTATPWTPAPEDTPFLCDNVIYDTSGYRNNGTVTSTTCPTWSNNSPRYRGSYCFNESQYICLGRGAMVTDAITFSFWMYMDTWNYKSGIISCTEKAGWSLGTHADGYIQAYMWGNGDYVYAISNQKWTSLSSGWHMFAVTYDGIQCFLYIDGKMDAKSQKATTKCPIQYHKTNGIFIHGEAGDNTTTPVSIGLSSCYSDVRIYATALSDSDITELYQSSASLDYTGKLMLSGEVIE